MTDTTWQAAGKGPGSKPAGTMGGRVVLVAGVGVGGLILLALTHALLRGTPILPNGRNLWLALHLASVIPAVPLGTYVLWRRKGDAPHRALGRLWAVLMLVAAGSSFGLGGLSPIHILSVLVLVAIPRGVVQAMRGQIAAHRRTMTATFMGLVGAGVFTFMPGRLLATWLFG